MKQKTKKIRNWGFQKYDNTILKRTRTRQKVFRLFFLHLFIFLVIGFGFFFTPEAYALNSCTRTVTGSSGVDIGGNQRLVQMTEDCDGGVITLGAQTDNNTIRIIFDCDNYTLESAQITNKSSLFARENFEIRNCTFRGNLSGLNAVNVEGTTHNTLIENVTIKNNTFYPFDAVTRAIHLQLRYSGASGYGQNIKIENNNVFDADTTPVTLSHLGTGSYVRNNRFIVKAPGSGYAPLYINSSQNTDVDGNYLECHKVTNIALGAGDRCDDDILIESSSNIQLFNNVFAGTGANSGGGAVWCPADKPKNIFIEKGYLDTGDPWMDIPAQACPKTCLDTTTIENYKNEDGTFELTENHCLEKNVQFGFIPFETAIDVLADNVTLHCNHSFGVGHIYGSDTAGHVGVRIGDTNNDNGYGYYEGSGGSNKPDNPKNTSIVDCELKNFSRSFELNNTYGVMLRSNFINIENAVPSLNPDYYIKINSVPFNVFDYGHYMYNYSSNFSSGNSAYWTQVANKIKFESQPEKYVYYFYNFVYDGTGGGPYSGINGSGEEFENIGHLTVAKVKGIGITNLDLNFSDPVQVAGATTLNDDFFNEYNFISSNDIKNGLSEGIIVVGSTDLNINNNILVDNEIGLYVSVSKNSIIYKNNASSYKQNSYGAQFWGISSSTVGSFNVPSDGNQFNENMGTGMYIHGNYFASPPNEKNVFVNNTISENGLWGVVATELIAYKFLDNAIEDNGKIDDCEINQAGDCPTFSSPQCGDTFDNDQDGLTDVADPDCISANDMVESYSPGFYLNFSHNSLFDGNIISGNTGDNLYIDATIMRNPDGSCSASGGSPIGTDQNIFINNTFNGSLHGSGVVLADGSQCTDGGVDRNSFGYFYLNPYSREGYTDLPMPQETFDYIQPISLAPSGILPLDGDNVMQNNALDGITITARNIGNGGYDVEQTDIYENTLSQNGRYGIFINGFLNKLDTKANDIVNNEISNNSQGGVFYNSSYFSRAYYNYVHDNGDFGIRLNDANNSSISVNYNQIGVNDIINNPVGVGVSNSPYTEVTDNTIDDVEWGINSTSSNSMLVRNNNVYTYTKRGIGAFLSSFGIINKNSITSGSGASIGLALINSSNWTFSCADRNNIDNILSNTAQYMYIGPDLGWSQYDFPSSPSLEKSHSNTHPYPTDQVKEFYNHTNLDCSCTGGNVCANYADGQPLYYYYRPNQTLAVDASWKNSKHLQIVGVSDFNMNFSTHNYNLHDPVHLAYLSTNGGGELISNLTLDTCRGDCLILYNVQGTDASQIEFDSITINDPVAPYAIRSGLKSYYSKYTKFDNITIRNANRINNPEQGGFYAYNFNNNEVRNSNFEYDGSGPTTVQWEMFLGGESKNNTILGNTFTDGTVGIGAWEDRPGVSNSLYDPPNPPDGLGNNSYGLSTRDDKFCYVESPSTGFCDPNCTALIDTDCAVIEDPFQAQTPFDGCTKYEGDCCFDAKDGTVDPDCLPGVDPDGAQVTYSIPEDGICTNNGTCDKNCTRLANNYCPAAPPDVAKNAGNFCHPLNDGTCDYDCPKGFDPDCVAEANIWCPGAGDDPNTFDNIPDGIPSGANFKKPNYFFKVGQTEFSGGGGIPNSAYLCDLEDPKTRIPPVGSVCEGGNCIRQYDNYRKVSQLNRSTTKNKFWVYSDYADAYGRYVEGRIQACNVAQNITCLQNNRVATFDTNTANISLFVPASTEPVSAGTKPTINNSNETGLYIGDFDSNSIPTISLGGTYPADVWADSTDYSRVKTLWNNATNLYSINGNYGTLYLYSYVSTGDVSFEPDLNFTKVLFTYDLKAPDAAAVHASFAFDAAASCPTCNPKTYKFTWNELPSLNENSWTDNVNKAHYEIWYGEDENEVKNRIDIPSASKPGPYVWDDMSDKSASGIPYETCSWGAGDGNCYDGGLDVRAGVAGVKSTILKTAISADYINFCVVDNYGNESCDDVSLLPYIETQFGNIYSRGDIGEDLLTDSRTVGSFLILASGTVKPNWDSAISETNTNFTGPSDIPSGFGQVGDLPQSGQQSGYNVLDFPDKANLYTSNIGSIDFLDYPNASTFSASVVSSLITRFGSLNVVDITTTGQNGISSNLGGKIYYFNNSNGTLTVDSPKVFNVQNDKNGSGLILVNGNLHINTTLSYNDSGADELKEIPSVAWLVLGDITFGTSADAVVGAYVALGTKGSTVCPEVTVASAKCGRISTGVDSQQFVLEGLMFARQIYFERILASDTTPSEKIIYDGRLLANTPPGLEDFVNGLPLWLEDAVE